MNHNEIESCVIKSKHGSKEALLKITEQFKPFIFKSAKAFNLCSFEINDLVQIGYIALINAVEKYNIGSHTFSSYAFKAIKNALKYTARKNSKSNWDLSLNTPLNLSKKNSEEFINCLEGTENIEDKLLKTENNKELGSALAKLSQEETELIFMIYYKEVPLSAYAREKAISYLTASRRKHRILKKLNCFLTLT